MTYGYLRVSTDQQDENNQKMGVDEKAGRMGLKIDEYIIDHGVSGTKEPEKRQLGKLMGKLKDGDLIIASELSRLGRSMYMVMRILEYCMKNGIKVITVKDNYELVDNIQSKVLAFAFSIAAEIERDMISRRTKEALARCKLNGIKLGRKPGKADKVKLTEHEDEIRQMTSEGKTNVEIGKRFGVHRQTVRYFKKDKNIPNNIKRAYSPKERESTLQGEYENIKKLREEGRTLKEISKMLGMRISTVHWFCKKNGIEKSMTGGEINNDNAY
jgi:DNA invertase Pin-like site-specific DNA recombinase